MRVIALLSLLFGFLAQALLDGQVFTHAIFGILCGIIAIASGLASARNDPPHRWVGRIMAGLGLPLIIWCAVMAPSAYQFQRQFNKRSRDAGLQETIVGTWRTTDASKQDSGEIIILEDGSFRSRWRPNPTNEWSYAGAWDIKDGFLICTITNSIVTGAKSSEPIGAVDRFKITQLDNAHLTFSNGDYTNSFDRK